MRKTHLPIAQPCHENWDSMDPVERGRFCHSCSKQVHHLSEMTEQEAKGLLTEAACNGERICVRYGCDTQGNIRFRPERTVAVAAAAAVFSMALAACSPHEHPQHQRTAVLPIPTQQVEPDPEPLMGEPMIVPEVVEPEPVEELMGDVAYVPENESEPCALTKPEAAAAARAKAGDSKSSL